MSFNTNFFIIKSQILPICAQVIYDHFSKCVCKLVYVLKHKAQINKKQQQKSIDTKNLPHVCIYKSWLHEDGDIFRCLL